MKRIDRLLIEGTNLRQAIGGELYLAMICRDGDAWISKGYLWDKVDGHAPNIERSAHDTEDAALEYIHNLALLHPCGEGVTIIVDDGMV